MKSNFLNSLFISSILSVAGCFEPFPEMQMNDSAAMDLSPTKPTERMLKLDWTPLANGTNCGSTAATQALSQTGNILTFNPSSQKLAPCTDTGTTNNFICNYQSDNIVLTGAELEWKQWALSFTPKLTDIQNLTLAYRFNSATITQKIDGKETEAPSFGLANFADGSAVSNPIHNNGTLVKIPTSGKGSRTLELRFISICNTQKSGMTSGMNVAPSTFTLTDLKLVPITP